MDTSSRDDEGSGMDADSQVPLQEELALLVLDAPLRADVVLASPSAEPCLFVP